MKRPKRVHSALTYPIVLLIFAFLMVSGLMVYVVPDMVAVIIESGQRLPLATQILIQINEVVANFWWLIAGFGFSIFVIIRWLLRSPKPRLLWDKAKFSLPLVARITKNSNAAGYTRILTRSTARIDAHCQRCRGERVPQDRTPASYSVSHGRSIFGG